MPEQPESPQVIETWTAGMFKFFRVSVPESLDDDALVEWAQDNLAVRDWLSFSADGSEVIFVYEKEA